MPVSRRSSSALCLVAFIAATPSLAPNPARAQNIESQTRVNYPPDRHVDYTHMKLEVRIDDMNVPKMECRQTLSFEVVSRTLPRLTLDAKLLDVSSVVWGDTQMAYDTDGRTLVVEFDPPLESGRRVDLVTTYSVTRPPEGLYWTPESAAWPGRAAQLHTQGEAQTSSYWFPCRDFPNDRLSTEVLATVPSGFVASSNGRLVAQTTSDDGAYETFHWLQDQPHVNYLVTLVVGTFDVVDLGSDVLPLPVYAPTGRGSDVQATYGNTPRMIEHFEQLLDEPYPWDRYAQLVVWNFSFGGMENTSATTMHDTAILSRDALIDHDMDGLIAHELAHQWFGDLLTCNSWEHIWLNEGFATYLTALWFEHRDGADGYQASILGNFDGLIAGDNGVAPHDPGMVSKVYDAPLETFFKPANPYSKGASLLHMLRRKLGDDVFFSILAAYLDRFRLDTVETPDFRKIAEELSGESLERFFTQWCLRPGIPRMEVSLEWDDATGDLAVSARQTQVIDGYNPAYVLEIPIWIEQAGGTSGYSSLFIDSKTASARIALDSEPRLVAVDPDMSVLAQWTIDQPEERWIAQLERGPTSAARVQAARALAMFRSPSPAASLLVRTAENERHHVSLRTEALYAIAARGEEGRLMALSGVTIESPDIRRALVESLTRVPDPSDPFLEFMSQKLDRAARTDPAQSVRAAAIRGIGAARVARRESVVISSLKVESQHDGIRQAALRSAADLDVDLALILPFSRPGYLSTTRVVALETVTALADQDVDIAFGAIAPLLHDQERRVFRAAGRALVDLGHANGVEALGTFIESTRDETDRKTARRWLDELESKLGAGG